MSDDIKGKKTFLAEDSQDASGLAGSVCRVVRKGFNYLLCRIDIAVRRVKSKSSIRLRMGIKSVRLVRTVRRHAFNGL